MRTSSSGKRLVVMTAGDPSGVGPEVILKSLADFAPFKKFTPLVIGDYGVFKANAKISSLRFSPFLITGPSDSFEKGRINFIDLANIPTEKFRFGKMAPLYGKASMEYIRAGLAILKNIKGASLVTAPINKESINKAGFRFTGHTEFLSQATGRRDITMMLVGGPLRVSLVTRHVSLNDAAKYVTKEAVRVAVENTYHALTDLFKIAHPRIGVAGLNPHAGEGGFLGNEEIKIISPAVEAIKKKIKGLSGPFPADTIFYKAYKGEFDAVVCMYHDQGLIPLKMIAFEKGVNLTLGLPFIRTSPDHGTGFDIAGKGRANPASMTEAIRLASRFKIAPC